MKTRQSNLFSTRILLLFIITSLPLASPAQNQDEIAIKQLLDKQIRAWNRGNIEDFMKGYWRSDSLLFIGKTGPKFGYTTTVESYKRSYPDTTAMGKLHFDLLQMKKLSSKYYFVVGKWNLARTIGNLEGYFTLLLNKVKKNWVIIADHSS